MAQSGYTPILIYASGTATNVPLAANMTSSASGAELALNYTDGKLYYKDNAGVVKLLASNATSAPVLTFSAGTTGFTPSTATSGAITLAGTLATTNGGTGLTSFTANGVVYASSTSALTTGSALVFNGTQLGVGTASFDSNWTPVLQVSSAATDGTSGIMIESYRPSLIFKDISASAVRQHIVADASALIFGSGDASFTERMRLDASGNLGIGTTTPNVAGGTRAVTLDAPTAGNYSGFELMTGGTLRAKFIGNSSQTYFGTETATPLVFLTGGTERARIDSSGNLGIGTTSPLVRLHAKTGSSGALSDSRYIVTAEGGSEAYLCAAASGFAGIRFPNASSASQAYIDYTHSSNHMAFGVNNGERARIDSSGNLLVGTTNASQSAGLGVKILSGNVSVVNAGGGDGFDFYNTAAGAYRFYVSSTGQISATFTTITAISDQRLKENIQDIDTGLDAVLALKPRRFDWKEGKGQDKKNAAGFIAQEFETVFPDSVGTSKAGEDGIEYKNICHEELIPTLVKAIQELKAIVDAQATRITALEGN